MVAPSALPEGVRGYCARHMWGSTIPGATCPRCEVGIGTGLTSGAASAGNGASGTPRTASVAAGSSAAPSKRRAGQDAEDALCAQLVAAGYIDFGRGFWTTGSFMDIQNERLFMRQFSWGAYLTPPRNFRADFAFAWGPSLLVEVAGLAHAAGRFKVKKDVERDGLAASLGYRVLKVSPEDVTNGTALRLVAAALAAKK